MTHYSDAWTGQAKEADVLWLGMAAIHLAGHQLWDTASVDVIGQSPTEASLMEDSLIEVYLAADAALGRIIRKLPANADLLVFWAKGMGPENGVTNHRQTCPA